MILQFLEVSKKFIRLDNAILNHSLRSLYLQALDGMTTSSYLVHPVSPGFCFDHGPSFGFRPKEPLQLKDAMKTGWIVNRNIHPLNISLYECNHENYFHLVEISRHVVQSLHFSECQGVETIFRLGNFPALKKLHVYMCCQQSDILQFLALNPQLEDLKFCMKSFSLDLFSEISVSCPKLTHLDISWNEWCTDECISHIIRGFPNLRHLAISSKRVRQHDSIVSILSSYPLLRSLDIHNCDLSANTRLYYLNEFAFPCATSDDQELQEIGLKSYDLTISVTSESYSFLNLSIHSRYLWMTSLNLPLTPGAWITSFFR
jgi:hypothetical protein